MAGRQVLREPLGRRMGKLRATCQQPPQEGSRSERLRHGFWGQSHRAESDRVQKSYALGIPALHTCMPLGMPPGTPTHRCAPTGPLEGLTWDPTQGQEEKPLPDADPTAETRGGGGDSAGQGEGRSNVGLTLDVMVASGNSSGGSGLYTGPDTEELFHKSLIK